MGEEAVTEDSGPAAGSEDAPALRVITAFGGIRPMANKLDVPVSTVQGWKVRGVIPEARLAEIREAAERHGVEIDEAALAASAEAPEEDAPEESQAAGTADEASEDTDGSMADSPKADSSLADVEDVSSGGRTHGGWLPGFIVGALVLAVGAGGAVLTRDQWDPRPGAAGASDGELADQVAKLETQLAELAKRDAGAAPAAIEGLATKKELSDLSAAITQLKGRLEAPDSDPAKLGERVTQLEGRVTSLDSGAAEGAKAATEVGGLQSEVAKLQGEFDQLQTQLAKLDDQTASLVSDQRAAQRAAAKEAALWAAVGRLRDALRNSGSYAPELETVRQLAAGTPGLADALAPLEKGAVGVPSLNSLQRSFPAAARAIVVAGDSDDSEGIFGDLLSRVSQVVTVRRTDEAPSDDVSASAVVARAEGHLKTGDLAAAVQELDALQGTQTKEAAAGWLAQAKSRLAVDGAISKLDGLMAGRLTTGG